MNTSEELRSAILRMDHKSYPAYKSLAGSWRFPDYLLNIDHVQGDPFASPSSLSVQIDGRKAGFPADFLKTKPRKTALEDRLVRRFSREVGRLTERARGSGKSGLIQSSRPGQEVLERTACRIHPETGAVLFRFYVGFPAFGRSIAANELVTILFDMLPKVIRSALFFRADDAASFRSLLSLTDDQQALRAFLKAQDLTAFVADDAVLPRESGISDRPMKDAVKFRSPDSLRVTAELPHAGKVSGMGLRKGVTLIVGGGYHGKSTLLSALERGVYDHIAGDGREFVVTDETAVKLRAEDGRSIRNTDISLFIDHLPGNRRGTDFSTENASGSTSQAANTIEAIEAGSHLFLIDEDTCATNFMIRDALMEQMVRREQEPITPFLHRIRPLYEEAGISTILVAGSSGLFFAPADTVIQMDNYLPYDITARAKTAVQEASAAAPGETFSALPPLPEFRRCPKGGFDWRGRNQDQNRDWQGRDQASGRNQPRGRDGQARGRDGQEARHKIKVTGIDEFILDRGAVQLGQVEQLTDREQTAALAYALLYLEEKLFDGKLTLQEAVRRLYALLEKEGPEALAPGSRAVPSLAMPRIQEIFACVVRYRGLRF
ncbi:MAG: ABC-ATPase domain-containing protein [Clostridium sp.]|nr:ABC-ATPase domain-containing protein [Clostridium sp.]